MIFKPRARRARSYVVAVGVVVMCQWVPGGGWSAGAQGSTGHGAAALSGRGAAAARAEAGPGGRPAGVRPGCPDNLADRLSSTGKARQLLTVSAASFTISVATVEAWRLIDSTAGPSCWQKAGGPWTALIGANGFSDHHREGDRTTPTGIYAIGPVMYGNAPNPGTRYPYHRLVCGDWWDEAPTSPEYNTFQHIPCGQAAPFGGDSEALWTETVDYPSLAVIEYNSHPVVPYAGSAIFIHAEDGNPTTGCVSLPLADLDRILRWLAPSASPEVAMGPLSELPRF